MHCYLATANLYRFFFTNTPTKKTQNKKHTKGFSKQYSKTPFLPMSIVLSSFFMPRHVERLAFLVVLHGTASIKSKCTAAPETELSHFRAFHAKGVQTLLGTKDGCNEGALGRKNFTSKTLCESSCHVQVLGSFTPEVPQQLP